MEDNQWVYQIRSGFTGTILSLVMLALFGGITYWLYTSGNGAFLFLLVLTAIMLAVFLAALYRALFYKIQIGNDCFFYQTTPSNGKRINYVEVEKAWTSSGIEHNGAESNYCNIAFPDGTVIRFPFYPIDSESVAYLLQQIEAHHFEIKASVEQSGNYQINGKLYGKTGIAVTFVILIFFTILCIFSASYQNFLFFLIPAVLTILFTLIFQIVRYSFFKVKIEKEGFYCRTAPFDGRYYKYNEIQSCQEIQKVYRYRNSSGGNRWTYCFYFVFTDKNGKTHKFPFEKPVYEHEINVLKERIEQAAKVSNCL